MILGTKKRNKSAEEESRRIVKTAANIIICEMRSIDYNICTYLTNSEIPDLKRNKKYGPRITWIFFIQIIKKT